MRLLASALLICGLALLIGCLSSPMDAKRLRGQLCRVHMFRSDKCAPCCAKQNLVATPCPVFRNCWCRKPKEGESVAPAEPAAAD